MLGEKARLAPMMVSYDYQSPKSSYIRAK